MTSILILFKSESSERIENLLSVVHFLSKIENCKIHILESSDKLQSLSKIIVPETVDYSFILDRDSVLHRTRFINKMVSEANTPILGIWDADVIISHRQIEQGIRLLQSNEAEFVIPYEKYALDTTSIIRKLFLEEGNIEILEQNQKKMKEMYAPNPLGGVFMVNRKAYITAGLENEDFYGWGMEDGERFYRWLRLGYRVKRVFGPLYHLSHPRGINSMFQNQDQALWKRKETLKAKRLAEATCFNEQTWSGE